MGQKFLQFHKNQPSSFATSHEREREKNPTLKMCLEYELNICVDWRWPREILVERIWTILLRICSHVQQGMYCILYIWIVEFPEKLDGATTEMAKRNSILFILLFMGLDVIVVDSSYYIIITTLAHKSISGIFLILSHAYTNQIKKWKNANQRNVRAVNYKKKRKGTTHKHFSSIVLQQNGRTIASKQNCHAIRIKSINWKAETISLSIIYVLLIVPNVVERMMLIVLHMSWPEIRFAF